MRQKGEEGGASRRLPTNGARHRDWPRAVGLPSNVFHVVGGRHPVIEAFQADKAQHFVQNDCHLGGTEPRICVITGYVRTQNEGVQDEPADPCPVATEPLGRVGPTWAARAHSCVRMR